MDNEKWISWKMQTSKRWEDVEDILKSINIDFIDYDHKILVEFALKLNVIIERSEYEFSLELVNATEVLLKDLYDYAVHHFRHEEQFMKNYKLPNIDTHINEHDYILNILLSHLEDFKNGKTKLDMKIKYQVMDWLIKHINIIDFEYFDLKNWSQNLVSASDWIQVKEIIRPTGLKIIDKQHQDLTETAIRMMEIIKLDKSEDTINAVFKDFRRKIDEHFSYEERFIEKYKIQNTYNHLDMYHLFKSRLDAFPKEIISGVSTISDVKIWILTWWINHINSTDKETFDYNNWAYQLIDTADTFEEVEIVLIRTGIEEVDNDHLALMVETFNLNKKIINYTESNTDIDLETVKIEISSDLKRIYEMARDHFDREEALMKIDYPDGLINHKYEHVRILEKFQELYDNFMNNRIYLSKNIKTMILDWWIQHTNTVDFRTFSNNKDEGRATKR